MKAVGGAGMRNLFLNPMSLKVEGLRRKLAQPRPDCLATADKLLELHKAS